MTDFKIKNRLIGKNQPCFIIAEAGSNHNGDLKTAKKLIDIAADSGADAVKFQTFMADKLYWKKHPAYEIVKNFEFRIEWHEEIIKYCKKRKIIFMTTPFHTETVNKLKKIKLDVYKIASGDMDHYPLLDEIAKTKKPVILSTGLANLGEVRESVNRLQNNGVKNLSLLHCVATYPTNPEDVNLNILKTLWNEFKIPVGFSDHSTGISIPIAAVAMGAKIIEKHFTISRDLEGMDHFYALEPDELKTMVNEIRKVEKAMGDYEKKPVQNEWAGRYHGRRSIVTSKDLKKGDILTRDDLEFVRPEKGIKAKYFEEIIGKKLKRSMKENDIIFWEDII